MPKRGKKNTGQEFENKRLDIDIIEKLGPHAKCLYNEAFVLVNTGSWVSLIILSATIIDVVANEELGPINKVDGLTKNKLFNSKNILWLRKKRNSIVHYERPTDGMMGGEKQIQLLSKDAKKSFEIMIVTLKKLFKDL